MVSLQSLSIQPLGWLYRAQYWSCLQFELTRTDFDPVRWSCFYTVLVQLYHCPWPPLGMLSICVLELVILLWRYKWIQVHPIHWKAKHLQTVHHRYLIMIHEIILLWISNLHAIIIPVPLIIILRSLWVIHYEMRMGSYFYMWAAFKKHRSWSSLTLCMGLHPLRV